MSTGDSNNRVQHWQVTATCHGQRIDNFLFRNLKGVPKSRIYRLLRRGEVRVNRGRVRADYRLQAGDELRIPPIRVAESGTPVVPQHVQVQLREAVLHEDRDVLVLDKPAGLAVHAGSGLDFGVIEALRASRGRDEFLELAHRLDRDTSGCLVLARNPETLRSLQEAFRQDHLEKRYLVLVQGQWDLGEQYVDAALDTGHRRGGERHVQVAAQGKPARTRFQPVNLHPLASLLEATLFTGRTHQIRVHAASVGHPVAGDERYGDDVFNRRMGRLGLQRLFLHAHRLEFALGGREYAFSTPLDSSLRRVLEGLTQSR